MLRLTAIAMRKPFLVSVLLLTFLAAISAQSMGGIVQGTVRDGYRKPISGVQIIATNQETKETYKAETNEKGEYRIEVPAGPYIVTTELQGFKPAKVPDVKVSEGQRKSIAPIMLTRYPLVAAR
jgi:phosphatidate phosphatase APP1